MSELIDLPPLPRMAELPPRGRVLAVAPHPDDEIIGCGGALALHVERGDDVRVLVLTDGREGDPEGRFEHGSIVTVRRNEARAAGAVLGIEDYVFWDYPDGRRVRHDEMQHLVERLVGLIQDFHPSVVYYPWSGEAHGDHFVASMVTRQALDHLSFEVTALGYEVWTPCRPDSILDVSSVRKQKIEALGCHESQLQYADLVARTEGMNRHRGLYLEGRDSWGEAFVEEMAGAECLPPGASRFAELLRVSEVLGGRTLVLSPHADDEVLAVGGTLALMRGNGTEARVLHLTDGAAGDPDGLHEDIVATRQAEGREALGILGVDAQISLGFGDGELHRHMGPLCTEIAAQIREWEPRFLLAPSPFESHRDHRAATQAVRRLVASGRAASLEAVAFYGVNTPGPCNVLIDISSVRETKARAVECFRSQWSYNDFRDKVEAAAVARTVNVDLAEVEACEALALVPVARVEAFCAATAAVVDVLGRVG